MEQRLKQRLIGAIVLVALAVIFIPMLLQGPVERHLADIPIEIPPKPAMNVDVQPQPSEGGAGNAPAASTSFTPSTPLDPASRPPENSGAPRQGPAELEPSAEPVAAGEPLESPPRTPSELAAWAVQVGSFGTQGNALGLRDRLRRKGYAAYTETIQSDGKTFYRVRVGPTIQREEAEQLQAKLARKESLKGLVVSHP
jgi:DedD protein